MKIRDMLRFGSLLLISIFALTAVGQAQPIITNCPPSLSGSFSLNFQYTFEAGGATTGTVRFDIISGPGSIDSLTGLWQWQPQCSDADKQDTLIVCARDDISTCPNDNECTVLLNITNSAPIIGGDCGKIISVCYPSAVVRFSATDADTGDHLTWAIAFIQGSRPFEGTAGIDSAGLLFISPAPADYDQDFDIAIRVSDCAGAYDECNFTLHLPTCSFFSYKIGKSPALVLPGSHALVPVAQNFSGGNIVSFDFLIAFDATEMSFTGAIAGPAFDIPGDYEWEYFTYRFDDSTDCFTGCPTGMLRVIGISDLDDGVHSPKANIFPNGFTLFSLDFQVSNLAPEYEFLPIRFFWNDCNDNIIKYFQSPENILSAVSIDVYDYDDSKITDVGGHFPSFGGATDSCLIYGGYGIPAPRFANFINGGIEVGPHEISSRGDINLNQIPYEIGDAILFTNYFISGLVVFTINVEAQMAATDINCDGILLEVTDFVYLLRVLNGEIEPCSQGFASAGDLDVRTSNEAVLANNELGAFYAVLDGQADVELGSGASGMQLKTGYRDGKTFVLVFSLEKGKTCQGEILKTGGHLISAEAADYFGKMYKVSIVPDQFAVRNYPNPFNASATIEMFLPEASHWDITIYNVAGQKIDRLSGESRGGLERVVWDASHQATGIYFYKVEAGKYSANKKMMLLK